MASIPRIFQSHLAGNSLGRLIAQEKSVAPAHADWITVENCAHVIMWNYPELTVDLIKKTAENVESDN